MSLPLDEGASTYRFLTTSILTGQVLADSLPIAGQSCTRQINSVGSFSGSIALNAGTPQMVRQWVAALEPWRSVLWVLQDGQPIWNGPVTGQPHQTITDGQLPIQAASMEEVFRHRQVSDNLIFTGVDVFEIFRQLLLYAVAKTPNGNIAGTGRYANSSGIVDNVAYSGVLASLTEQASLKKIYDVFGDLVTTYGLEYALTPALADAGSLFTLAQMGLPAMGRKYADTALSIVFPGRSVLDYGWQRGSGAGSVANLVVVTGSGASSNPVSFVSQLPHGEDLTELGAGYPLLEDSAAFTGSVTAQSQVDAHADGIVGATAILKQVTPTFTLGATAFPKVRDIMLGDEVAVAATSPLHPADPNTGGPGVTGLFRITGWTLTFPQGGQAETTLLQLGGLANIAA